MKQNDAYTILVLPGHAAWSYCLSVRKRTCKYALGALSVTLFWIGFSVYNDPAQKQFAELSVLEEERTQQQAKIREFAFTIEGLKKQVARLQEMDRRVRMLTNAPEDISSATDPKSAGGMGGPELLRDSQTAVVNPARSLSAVEQEMRWLQAQASQQERHLEALEARVQSQNSGWAFIPTIWPTRGRFVSGFGGRPSPFTGLPSVHHGVDIAAAQGTPVVAPAAGTVDAVGRKGGMGNRIEIEHRDGLRTLYGHLSEMLVRRGQTVQRGQVIGYVGNTGLSSGPHLHYEVHLHGVPINPIRYIAGAWTTPPTES